MTARLLTPALIILTLCYALPAYADTVEHKPNGGAELVATVDNDGGQSGRFRFVYKGVDQFGEGNLILWDGSTNYDGREDDDFAGSGSALVLYDPAVGFGLADEVTGSQTIPYLPTSFADKTKTFSVEQQTYARDDGNYVIYHWSIENTSSMTLPAKLLFLIDWDLNDSEDDNIAGWDPARNLAWQQDAPANGDNNFTTGGIALLSGTLDNYHLGECCDLRSNDNTQDQYFQGIGTGTLANLQADLEIGVSADLGPMPRRQKRCVAFVELIADGTSSADAMNNLHAELAAAQALWATIPGAGSCAGMAVNPGLAGAWFNPATLGQGFFLDVFPTIPLVFLSWFTWDTSSSGGANTAVVGHQDQRWITAQGGFAGDTANLAVTLTTGGLFDNPQATSNTNEGTITLNFTDCKTGNVAYNFTGAGVSGNVPITRIADDNVDLCESLLEDGGVPAK